LGYSDEQLYAIVNTNTAEEYYELYPEERKKPNAWRSMRFKMKQPDDGRWAKFRDEEYVNGIAPSPPVLYTDKKVGEFNWREANVIIGEMQTLKQKAAWSQTFAEIAIDTDEPICILALSDAHIGDWATNHDLLEQITDEILATPNLYVALLGDMAQMAIKLRSVSEVTSNMLPPDLQLAYFDSWLNEIADRILFCTWDNHAVDREESASGISAFAKLQSKRFVYHSGIGHPDVRVGNQVYKFAVSHRFMGRSIENPCHAPMRYLRREGHDRDIAIMGDFHVPGIVKFVHGPTTKVAMNSGTFQLHSSYAKRWFSIFTHPVMPCVVLHPDRHEMTPLWSVAEWKAMQAKKDEAA